MGLIFAHDLLVFTIRRAWRTLNYTSPDVNDVIFAIKYAAAIGLLGFYIEMAFFKFPFIIISIDVDCVKACPGNQYCNIFLSMWNRHQVVGNMTFCKIIIHMPFRLAVEA